MTPSPRKGSTCAIPAPSSRTHCTAGSDCNQCSQIGTRPCCSQPPGQNSKSRQELGTQPWPLRLPAGDRDSFQSVHTTLQASCAGSRRRARALTDTLEVALPLGHHGEGTVSCIVYSYIVPCMPAPSPCGSILSLHDHLFPGA